MPIRRADTGCNWRRCAWRRYPTLRGDAMHPISISSAAARYLTNAEAAAFLRLSPRTLEKQRVIGGGPRFRKFGRRVLYAIDDLEAWADERSFANTSEVQEVKPEARR